MNLFLFPHQDDEYGAYPILEELAARRESVQIIYLTSGTLDGSLSQQRNRESTEVLSRMGIDQASIRFLGVELNLPDGKLSEHIESAAAALLKQYRSGEQPTRVFTPAWEGGHQDHDAAYVLACYLAQKFACLEKSRQFPLYTGYGLAGPLWRTFYPLPANGPVESGQMGWQQRLRYLGYCLSYRSQWSTWLGLYPMYALKLFFSGEQYLQPLNPERLKQEPHLGRCLYERRGFCSRQQFVYHTRAMVDKIIQINNSRS